MEFTREQQIFMAGLIANHLCIDLQKQFEKFKNDLNPRKDVEAVKMVNRRFVAKQFAVIPDTISHWVNTGILDKTTYTIINGRFKFFKEKIDNLLNQQREGTWEPNKKFI